MCFAHNNPICGLYASHSQIHFHFYAFLLSCHNSPTSAKHALRLANNRYRRGVSLLHQQCENIEVALVNLACGLWRPVCPTVAPTPSTGHSPLRWQFPAPALLCPWGPLPNHPPALTLPGKFKELRRGTIPVPHPTLWSYFHHTYIQMGRQICFRQLWPPDWPPEANMWADAHTLWSLSFHIRTSCVKSAHLLFYLALKSSQIGQFYTSCMFRNYLLNSLHSKIKTIFCT